MFAYLPIPSSSQAPSDDDLIDASMETPTDLPGASDPHGTWTAGFDASGEGVALVARLRQRILDLEGTNVMLEEVRAGGRVYPIPFMGVVGGPR